MNEVRRSVAAIAAALVVGLCGCASSSTTTKVDKPAQPQAPTKPDAHASYEPRSGPGEGQKLLSQMAGDWKVVRTFYPRGGGQPTITQGECKQTMIHDGRFLKSDFVFHEPNGDTTGTGMIGFDPETGRFTSFWVDSRSTRFSVRASEDQFDGTQIILYSQTVGEPGKNARRSRTISILEDGGKRLLHRQYSDSPDAPPRLVMQMEMTLK
jgi:hypothetical protein